MTRFTFNPDKFINAVLWFARNCGECTKLKVCKLLYFADKEHLIRYGRPITGDSYYKLKNGPIPTAGLNILRGKSSPANKALAGAAFDVRGWKIIPKAEPDLSVFSKSDISVLQDVFNRLGKTDVYALRDKSHEEPWWDKTKLHERIDFELLIEGDSEEAKAMREYLRESQTERDALRRYMAVV